MWVKVIDVQNQYFNSPFVFSHLFKTSVLTVYSSLPGATRTFKLAGKLVPLFYDSAFGISKGKPRKFYLDTQQIVFDNPLGLEYKLELALFPWIAYTNLMIWENTNLNVNLALLESIKIDLIDIETKIDNI